LRELPRVLDDSISLSACSALTANLVGLVSDPKPRDTVIVQAGAGLLPGAFRALVAAACREDAAAGGARAGGQAQCACSPGGPTVPPALASAVAVVQSGVFSAVKYAWLEGGQRIAAAALDSFTGCAAELATFCVPTEGGGPYCGACWRRVPRTPPGSLLLSSAYPSVYAALLSGLWSILLEAQKEENTYNSRKRTPTAAVGLLPAIAHCRTPGPATALAVAKIIEASACGEEGASDAEKAEMRYLAADALGRWGAQYTPLHLGAGLRVGGEGDDLVALSPLEAEAAAVALRHALALAFPPLAVPHSQEGEGNGEDEYAQEEAHHRTVSVQFKGIEAVAVVAACCPPAHVAATAVRQMEELTRSQTAPLLASAGGRSLCALLALLAPAADVELLRQEVVVEVPGGPGSLARRRNSTTGSSQVCADAVDRLGEWLLALAAGTPLLSSSGDGRAPRRINRSRGGTGGTASRAHTTDSWLGAIPSARTKRLSAAYSEEQLLAAVAASDPSLVPLTPRGGRRHGEKPGWQKDSWELEAPGSAPRLVAAPRIEVKAALEVTDDEDDAPTVTRASLTLDGSDDEDDERIVTHDVVPVSATPVMSPLPGPGASEEIEAFSDSDSGGEGGGSGRARGEDAPRHRGHGDRASEGLVGFGGFSGGGTGRADTLIGTEDEAALPLVLQTKRGGVEKALPLVVDPDAADGEAFELAPPVRGLDPDEEVDAWERRKAGDKIGPLSLSPTDEDEGSDEEIAAARARVALAVQVAAAVKASEEGEPEAVEDPRAAGWREVAAHALPAVARALVGDLALAVNDALRAPSGVHVHRRRTRALLHNRVRLLLRVISRLYRGSEGPEGARVTASLIVGLVDTAASLIAGIEAIGALTASVDDAAAWERTGGGRGGQGGRPMDARRLGAVLLCVLCKGLGRAEEATVLASVVAGAALISRMPTQAHAKLLAAMLAAARVHVRRPALTASASTGAMGPDAARIPRRSLPGLAHLGGGDAHSLAALLTAGEGAHTLLPSITSPARAGIASFGSPASSSPSGVTLGAWGGGGGAGWRVRAALAVALPATIPHLDAHTLATLVMPAILECVNDPVACIREPAAGALAVGLGALWHAAQRPTAPSELSVVQKAHAARAPPPPIPLSEGTGEGWGSKARPLPLGSPAAAVPGGVLLPVVARSGSGGGRSKPPTVPESGAAGRGEAGKGNWFTRWLGGSPQAAAPPLPPLPLPLAIVLPPAVPSPTPVVTPVATPPADTSGPSRALALLALEDAVRSLQAAVGPTARHPSRVAYITLCRTLWKDETTAEEGTASPAPPNPVPAPRCRASRYRLLFDSSAAAAADGVAACASWPTAWSAPLAAAVLAAGGSAPLSSAPAGGVDHLPLGWTLHRGSEEAEKDVPAVLARGLRELEDVRLREAASSRARLSAGRTPASLSARILRASCRSSVYDTQLKLPLLRVLRAYRPGTYWWGQVAPLAGQVACTVAEREWAPVLAREALELHLSSALRKQRWAAEQERAARDGDDIKLPVDAAFWDVEKNMPVVDLSLTMEALTLAMAAGDIEDVAVSVSPRPKDPDAPGFR